MSTFEYEVDLTTTWRIRAETKAAADQRAHELAEIVYSAARELDVYGTRCDEELVDASGRTV